MSLNHKEIDLILQELDIQGAQIQTIVQPSYDSLVLGLYGHGLETSLFISIAAGGCRIHTLSRKIPKADRPLRFMECLRSRIRGGRIQSISQIADERIVKIEILITEGVDAEAMMHLRHPYILYARLWSGSAGNILLVDGKTQCIVDLMARRPKRGELSGEPCTLEEDILKQNITRGETLALDGRAGKKTYQARIIPGEGTYNSRIEAFYDKSGTELSRDKLLETARERFAKRKALLEERIARLEELVEEFRDAERSREIADILMSAVGSEQEEKILGLSRQYGKTQATIKGSGVFVQLEDFYRGGTVSIEVDPGVGMAGNALHYYQKHTKALSGLAGIERELEETRESLTKEEKAHQELLAENEVFRIARILGKAGTASASGSQNVNPVPGLVLEVAGWKFIIGRSAKENDDLLRHHIKGSDLWMHARDWTGSYVFIKARPGKSIPLPILLDAGMLALYYSKGRKNGQGDLYYTFAKYLRRVKGGPKGLVLPCQEKNIHVRIDDRRMHELLSLTGVQDL